MTKLLGLVVSGSIGNTFSFEMSHDALNDDPPTPPTSPWAYIKPCLEKSTHFYTRVEGIRGIQCFLKNSRNVLCIGLYVELCKTF